MHTAIAHGVSFNSEDLASAGPHQRLRSDALAVALALALHAAKQDLPAAAQFFSERVCIVDPNVAFLVVRMQRCDLGPMDLLRKATVICVPIANFDTDEPEGGYHWTMLFLQKRSATVHHRSAGTKKSSGDGKGDNNDSASAARRQNFTAWYPPVHVDSAVQQGGISSNTRFAQRAARVIMQGLRPLLPQQQQQQQQGGGGSGGGNNNDAEDDAAASSSSSTAFEYEQSLVTALGNLSLIPHTPQQHNPYDCGIFSALAVHAVLQMIGREAVVVDAEHDDDDDGGAASGNNNNNNYNDDDEENTNNESQQEDGADGTTATTAVAASSSPSSLSFCDLTSALFPLPAACRLLDDGGSSGVKTAKDLIWPFDQEVANEFREIVYAEMVSAFTKRP